MTLNEFRLLLESMGSAVRIRVSVTEQSSIPPPLERRRAEDLSPTERPPLGVMSYKLWDEMNPNPGPDARADRQLALLVAIERYRGAKVLIPEEWIREYQQAVARDGHASRRPTPNDEFDLPDSPTILQEPCS
jgi:hypothetical protein